MDAVPERKVKKCATCGTTVAKKWVKRKCRHCYMKKYMKRYGSKVATGVVHPMDQIGPTLKECYENAVGVEARLRFRRVMRDVA